MAAHHTSSGRSIARSRSRYGYTPALRAGVPRVRRAGARLAVDRLHVHQPHQPPHPVPSGDDALAAQMPRHLPAAVDGCATCSSSSRRISAGFSALSSSDAQYCEDRLTPSIPHWRVSGSPQPRSIIPARSVRFSAPTRAEKTTHATRALPPSVRRSSRAGRGSSPPGAGMVHRVAPPAVLFSAREAADLAARCADR